MQGEHTFAVDIRSEVERYFDPSSVTKTQPEIALLLGGVCSGKTTLRREGYASGYVVLDAAEIFLSLSRGHYYPFPSVLDDPLRLIGDLIASRAIRERRNVVTEMIGSEFGAMRELIDAARGSGYRVNVVYVECAIEQAVRRNEERGDDNISAYYTEPYHRTWLLESLKQSVPQGA